MCAGLYVLYTSRLHPLGTMRTEKNLDLPCPQQIKYISHSDNILDVKSSTGLLDCSMCFYTDTIVHAKSDMGIQEYKYAQISVTY